jgi:UDP-N-acetyl-D-glucosamine dehydrogenase
VTNPPSTHDEKYVAIVGQGYVGLPLAVAAASAGWKVVGIEISESRVEQLNLGSSPVEDVSDAELQEVLSSKKYLATTEVSNIEKCRIVIVCVPTPLNGSREPDLSLVETAILKITPYLSDQTLIVSESTSYPGTLRNFIVPMVKANSKSADAKYYFASAPERVNPGDKNWNMKNTPRLVGGIDLESQKLAMDFYESICDEVVATSSPEIAEAAKLLENTFRMVNISLIQELTQILNKAGISANEVIDASSTKPYGFMPFRPSVGIGGHCIPIDPLYLTWWAKEQGQQANLVEKADQISQSMPQYIAKKTLSLVDKLKKSPTVMILGVAYKPGVSDTRESPVLLLKSSLESTGATVIWHDPLVNEWAGSKSSDLDAAFDVAVIATNQPGMNVASITARGIRVLDCTNNFGHLDGVEVL